MHTYFREIVILFSFQLKKRLDVKRKDARKTGGGPEAPSCTPAEEALLQVMHDRPVMIGFSGIDSDGKPNFNPDQK